MATTSTPTLQLLKPTPGTNENVNVQTQLNDNWDKIDDFATDTNAAIVQILKKHKPADESVANDTLQPDNDLFLPVEANSVYFMTAWLPYSGPAAPNGGFKPSWILPAAATMEWASYGTNGHSGGTNVEYDVVVQAAAGGRLHPTNAGTAMSMRPSGTLFTLGTAGTIALWWAQATTHATPTILKKGAILTLIKIA